MYYTIAYHATRLTKKFGRLQYVFYFPLRESSQYKWFRIFLRENVLHNLLSTNKFRKSNKQLKWTHLPTPILKSIWRFGVFYSKDFLHSKFGKRLRTLNKYKQPINFLYFSCVPILFFLLRVTVLDDYNQIFCKFLSDMFRFDQSTGKVFKYEY